MYCKGAMSATFLYKLTDAIESFRVTAGQWQCGEAVRRH